MIIIDTFQSRLRKALQMKGMKQTDLAKIMHTGRSTVSQWINGRNGTGSERAYQIAQVLNIDPSWLIGADVPFSTFEDAMQKIADKNINEQAMDRFIKLSESNKKIALGYIDGLLSTQHD